jgi:hypothetical protein
MAVGVNVYVAPSSTVVGGAPEIVGGELTGADPVTVIVNAGSSLVSSPSVTPMTMLA